MVGADVGGTSTRVAVADPTGRVLSLVRRGPGNPNSVGLAASAAEILAATTAALATAPGRVVSVVLGLAGGSRAAADPTFVRAAVPDLPDATVELVSDLAVAYCSATPALRGYALVAGTGAVAGEIDNGKLVGQRDGWGWLLGDEGSGFWIGRAAVRVTLAGLQGTVPVGPLARAVLQAADCQGYLDLLQACYAATPTWLARFSPLVSEFAAADPLAARIVEQAVDHLEGLLLSLDPAPGLPVVLAGSVLSTAGPIRRAFTERLLDSTDHLVLTSRTPIVGALWIALQGRGVADPAVHARLSASAAAQLANS